MRISDWSSDVCSSDLATCAGQGRPSRHLLQQPLSGCRLRVADGESRDRSRRMHSRCEEPARLRARRARRLERRRLAVGVLPGRSEEHTSELQSLMRISYAVFCFKKKKKTKRIQ